MHPRVLAAVTANGGLITRGQLLDLEVGPGGVRTLLRGGGRERRRPWVVVRRGVYCPPEIWDELDEYVGRPLLRARAAGLTTRRGWVLSHDSACHLQGLPMLRVAEPHVHLTRPGWRDAWKENGVKHHLARFHPDQVVEVQGVRCLDLARTAIDIGREHGFRHGLVACDAAMRRGVGRDELWAAISPMDNWPGITGARQALQLADPGAETVLETLTRELVLEADIGTPETQFPVRTSRGIAWLDMVVGTTAVEADGKVKVTPVASGGLSTDPVATLWEEKLRERAVADLGLVVVRVVWEDLWGRRRQEALARLRRAHLESVQRFGATMPARLVAEAVEIRAQYGDRRTA